MSGLLGFTLADLASVVDARKRQAARVVSGLLSDPGITLAQLAAIDREQTARDRATLGNRQSVMPEVRAQAAEQDLMNTANAGGLLGMIAYHGSPHKFDKFDMSKIGTGEGAQAYGHGLYFAESPATAKSYQHGLSDWYPNGIKPTPGSAEDRAAAYVAEAIDAQHGHPLPAAIQKIKRLEENPEAQDAMLKAIGKWSQEGAQWKRGNLYKVDIPDEAVAKMLDWDKPLSQQPEAVQQLVAKVQAERNASAKSRPLQLSDINRDSQGAPLGDGGRVYQYLSSPRYGGSQEQAAAMLRAAGIPGIRYLDAGSRGKGGTSNFVLFDDQLPKIVGRE